MTSISETFGLSCPDCGRDDGIVIDASRVSIRLIPDGSEAIDGTHEWDRDDYAHCEHCKDYGKLVRDFDTEGNCPQPRVNAKDAL